MKKYVMGLLTGMVIMLSIGAFAEIEIKVYPNKFPIIVKGQQKDIQSYIIDDRTYLQLKDISDALGVETAFNPELQQIEINNTNTSKGMSGMEIKSGNSKIKSNTLLMNNNSTVFSGPLPLNTDGIWLLKDGVYYIQYRVISWIEGIKSNDRIEQNGDVVKKTAEIESPGKPIIKIEIINNNECYGDGWIFKYDRLFISLSALGLTATEDGDTLWIE